MLRYLYRFALPGGRRVIIAYFPPKPVEKENFVPQKEPDPLYYDRVFAQAGLYSGVPVPRWIPARSRHDTRLPRGKRTR